MNMNMNTAFFLRKEDKEPKWRIIDAKDKVLGRLATEVTEILRGKDKPFFTYHTDCGDYVIIINADKVKLTGDKWNSKEYVTYSGWIGGQKVTKAKDLVKRHPTRIVEMAIKRMLPKNKLSDQIYKKLKVYAGERHGHQAQQPQVHAL